jgi:hypothetical protein
LLIGGYNTKTTDMKTFKQFILLDKVGSITTYRAYQGSRGLPKYFFGVQFNSSHGNGYLEINSD